jgi:enediyne biosynthesis protein E3
MGNLSKKLFGIAPEETSFSTRGFRYDSLEVRSRLEEVGRCFVYGYHAALDDDRPLELGERLGRIDDEFRGFAYEGAAMALAILDALTPWRRHRLAAFLAGPAAAQTYIVHVGAGWALARLPLSPRRMLARFDPVQRWLLLDGYGFHQGFFHWPRAVVGQEVPRRISGYALRAFDQGLGRSLWFVEGTDRERIRERIARFPGSRQADLWSGVGLACAYAGGVSGDELATLHAAAGEHAAPFAQGTSFAAKCRVRAGHVPPHTESACQAIWGLSTEATSALTDDASIGLPGDGEVPAFEIWRQRIQRRFASGGMGA